MKRKICIVIALLIVLGSILLFRLNTSLEKIYENSHIRVYSLDVFGNNLLIDIDKKKLSESRVIVAGGELICSPEVLRVGRSEKIVLFTKEYASIYSTEDGVMHKFIPKDKYIVSGCIGKIDKGYIYKLLLITAENNSQYGDHLVIANIDDKVQFHKILEKRLTSMKPMKIQLGDIDGDRVEEISIEMYKKTPFNPIMARRPFIYKWIGHDIAPKWLGSRLSMPFEDFIFADINNDHRDELISIEITSNQKRILRAYSWRNFGFEAIGNSGEYYKIIELIKGDNEVNSINLIKVKAYEGHRYLQKSFIFKDNKLEEYKYE